MEAPRAVRSFNTRIRFASFLLALLVAGSAGVFALYLGSRGHAFVLPLDDAYCYLEYARTAAAGHWGAYFPGAPVTTGATSFLWLVGMIKAAWILKLFGANLETALPVAALLGCTLALAVALWLMLRLGTRHGAPFPVHLLPWLLALVSPIWLFGAMNGMETGLYSLALLGGAWVLAGGHLLWLLPLALVRPDGAIVALGILVWRLGRVPASSPSAGASVRRGLSASVSLVLAGALVSLTLPWVLTGHAAAAWAAKSLWLEPRAEIRAFYLPRLPYFGWRCLWFGLSGARSQPPLDLAETMLRGAAWPVWASALFLGSGAVLALLRGRGRGLVILWVIASLSALIPIAWDAQFYRYLVPAYPLLLVASVLGWFGGARREARKLWLPGAVLLLLSLVGSFAAPRGLGPTMRRLYRGECERIESAQLRIGHWIADNLPPDARVATHDVGAIAFAGRRPIVDLVGLVTPAMAGAYRHGEGALWEALDALPVDARPTHAAVIPAWIPYLSRTDVFEKQLFTLPAASSDRSPVSRAFEVWSLAWPSQNPNRFPGGDFDNVPFTYGPASDRTSWNIVDELDIADLASEAAHAFHEEHGTGVTVVRELGFGLRSEGLQAAAIEGGRDILGTTRFVVDGAHPGPALLLLRATTVEEPDLIVHIGTWSGNMHMTRNEHVFQETAVLIPSQVMTEGRVPVMVEGKGYRAFHWWLLQETAAEDIETP
jgi:hypothetical protein